MPLPCIRNNSARRCAAKAKSTQRQCNNPAAFVTPHTKRGVCRLHGARRPETILSGSNHPNYRNGCHTKKALEQASLERDDLNLLKHLMKKTGMLK